MPRLHTKGPVQDPEFVVMESANMLIADPDGFDSYNCVRVRVALHDGGQRLTGAPQKKVTWSRALRSSE